MKDGHGDGEQSLCWLLQSMENKVQAERQIWEAERCAWEGRSTSFLTKHEQLEKDHQVLTITITQS